MTNMKLKYIAPAVKRSVEIEMESDLLAGSVVTNSTNIETAAQKVDEHSFGDSSFDSKWE